MLEQAGSTRIEGFADCAANLFDERVQDSASCMAAETLKMAWREFEAASQWEEDDLACWLNANF